MNQKIWSAVSNLMIGNVSKVTKSAIAGFIIVCSTMSAAHSELSIQEREPESSIANQYAALKEADETSEPLHQLIAELNRRVTVNPTDSLAWELLAQIYYNNGYHANAVYAASEAVEKGYSTPTLKRILLNSSAIVAQNQLKEHYLATDVNEDFIKEYQNALSKIYGSIYNFNYDESLPKPPAPIVRPKARQMKNTSSSRYRAPVPKKVKTTAKKKTVVQKPRVAPKVPPAKQPIKSLPSNRGKSSTTDPFKILR